GHRQLVGVLVVAVADREFGEFLPRLVQHARGMQLETLVFGLWGRHGGTPGEEDYGNQIPHGGANASASTHGVCLSPSCRVAQAGAVPECRMLIQKLRLKRGWSQQQLADASGLSVRTIQRIENGAAASTESLKCLAAVFEVDF